MPQDPTNAADYPLLEIVSPSGERKYHYLGGKHQLTIGRTDENEIALPDPECFISKEHCRLECRKGFWWVCDDSKGAKGEPSANGTFLRRAEDGFELDVREKECVRLRQGDAILLLGALEPPEDQPKFWQLIFREGSPTNPVLSFQTQTLTYSLSELKLQSNSKEIRLRPQLRKLLHFMAEKNYANHGRAIVCTYAELIPAIWEEPFGHGNNDIAILVSTLRKQIERDPSTPRHLITVFSEGYRLENVKVID